MLTPLFSGLLFSLFSDVFSSAQIRYLNGFSYIHIAYNDINYGVTILLLLIPLLVGFILMRKALKTTRNVNLRRNIKFFTTSILPAVTSSYVLRSREVFFHLPPLSSITISIGIGISSLSFKTKSMPHSTM